MVPRSDANDDPRTTWLITVYYKNELLKTMHKQYYHLAQEKYKKFINIRLRFRNDFDAGKVNNPCIQTS